MQHTGVESEPLEFYEALKKSYGIAVVGAIVTGKGLLFFAVTLFIGLKIYPLLKFPFQNKQGKDFTYILILGFSAGEFAEHLGASFHYRRLFHRLVL